MRRAIGTMLAMLLAIAVSGCGITRTNQASVVMEGSALPLQHVSVTVESSPSTTTDYEGRFWYQGRKVSGEMEALYGVRIEAIITPRSVIEMPDPEGWGEQWFDDLIGFNCVYVGADGSLREISHSPFRWNKPVVKVRLDIPPEYHEWYDREVLGYWRALIAPVLSIATIDAAGENILVQHIHDPNLTWKGSWTISSIAAGLLEKGVIRVNTANADAFNLALNRHEFGHALGLIHSRQPGSLMYPFLAGIENMELTPAEELVLHTLYSIPAGIMKPGTSAQVAQQIGTIIDY